MVKKLYFFFAICCILFIAGCAQINETAKVIWGSSTRALEDARAEAIGKTYRCSFNDCYDTVVSLARREEVSAPVEEEVREGEEVETKTPANGYFDIFINNRKKRHLVVMGVSGNIKTTEVGIFFTQPTLTTIGVEVSSLSSSAKRKVAEVVFDELTRRFSEVQ